MRMVRRPTAALRPAAQQISRHFICHDGALPRQRHIFRRRRARQQVQRPIAALVLLIPVKSRVAGNIQPAAKIIQHRRPQRARPRRRAAQRRRQVVDDIQPVRMSRVGRIHIRPRRHQHADNLRASQLGGDNQRRNPLRRPVVRNRPRPQRRPHNIQVRRISLNLRQQRHIGGGHGGEEFALPFAPTAGRRLLTLIVAARRRARVARRRSQRTSGARPARGNDCDRRAGKRATPPRKAQRRVRGGSGRQIVVAGRPLVQQIAADKRQLILYLGLYLGVFVLHGNGDTRPLEIKNDFSTLAGTPHGKLTVEVAAAIFTASAK